MTAGAGAATAQTVIVTSAPTGSSVELVLNTKPIATATADARGEATLTLNISANAGKNQTDVTISVDDCGSLRRVILVEPGLKPPPPEAACTRREIFGIFLVLRVSTIVIDVAGTNPTVFLRQGPVDLRAIVTSRVAPLGLIAGGGGGFMTAGGATATACGDEVQCDVSSGLSYTAGVAYWFTRFIAAEGTYTRLGEVKMNGEGQGFRFDHLLDARVWTLAAKLGGPAGPMRVYGQAGMGRHDAIATTTQTNDERTVTIGEDVLPVQGGTQSFQLKTAGWGYHFGGGLEGWVAPAFAIYAEGGRLWLKGSAVGGGEGTINSGVMFLLFGARVRLFGP